MRSQEKNWTRVIQALGRIGDPAAAASVRPFLADELERRRIAACVALSALKDTTSIPLLVERLDDPILTVRAAASAGLRAFGSEAIGPLAQRLSRPGPERSVAVETLGAIAVALKDSAATASLDARSLARRTLMAELDRAIASADAPGRAAAVAALLDLGEPEMREYVRLKLLDESDPLVKRTYETHRERER
jgi:HEAT repeat protein